mmetsp:Transcript_12907/g.18556  ORF Transcript_12907/g.18556 Transcript_12907/m.18556 type:complete len:139 (+) Transcript_12907:1004-1420(+)
MGQLTYVEKLALMEGESVLHKVALLFESQSTCRAFVVSNLFMNCSHMPFQFGFNGELLAADVALLSLITVIHFLGFVPMSQLREISLAITTGKLPSPLMEVLSVSFQFINASERQMTRFAFEGPVWMREACCARRDCV